jgi:hypothetical protein
LNDARGATLPTHCMPVVTVHESVDPSVLWNVLYAQVNVEQSVTFAWIPNVVLSSLPKKSELNLRFALHEGERSIRRPSRVAHETRARG